MTSRTTTALASKAPSASKKAKGTRFALAFATALTPVWVLADTLPTGGTVVQGTATINAPTANSLTINQGSNRAVVNWDGFSVGAGNTVNINQPSTDAAILNRVTGDTTSQIHGSINANGRVFVVNPNGIFIGKSGAVNAGGFVASTLDIRNDDFMTGTTVFEGDGSSATVENRGNIQVVTGGYAALIGGRVKNSGTIQAPLGFVGLGSGERITLDLAGNGFLQVAIPTDSDDDELDALIENSGTIQANGGTVQISAATARNAARNAINMSGVIEARTVSGRNGRVTLGGGGGGKVTVSGKVRTSARRPAIQVTQSARPKMPPARGGDITITGQDITLAGADIDASGLNGGGNIRIGGELQGGPGLPTADTLTVDTSTMISADALLNGDGGRVINWSELSTDFGGTINIRGGAEGGNGGFAEVSGRQDLSYSGFTNALAANGEAGELLLDPADIEIVAGPVVFNQIRDTDLEAQLAGANVTINTSLPLPDPADYPNSVLGFGEQPGDLGTITVTTLADVTWNSGTTLTLNADADIILNGDVTPNAGALDMQAGGRVVVNGAVAAVGGSVNADAGADFALAGSGSVNTSSGILTVDAGSIEIDGSVDISSGMTNLTANTSLVIENANLFDATAGSTTMSTGTATIARPLTITNGDLTLNASSNIGITTSGSILGANSTSIIDSSIGSIVLDGPILTPGGSTTMGAYLFGGTITPGAGGEINTGLFNLTSGAWQQNGLGGPIANFSATNFVLNAPDASFLRVLDGGGSGTPLEVADIFGLQGVGTISGSDWELVNDIDAAPTSGWIALDTAAGGQLNQGFEPFDFSGTFEGNGNTISNLFVRKFNNFAMLDVTAGMFGSINLGSTVSNLNLVDVDVVGPTVGALAGLNSGTVNAVSVTGTIGVNGANGGGIAGRNAGTIDQSRVNVVITEVVDPTSPTVPGSSIGGIAGDSVGAITRVKSEGSITASRAGSIFVGGIAGNTESGGTISDAYSTASVTADTTDPAVTLAAAGGIVGGIGGGGSVNNVLAVGSVNLIGGPGTGLDVGAVVGGDDPSPTSIQNSFFDPVATGQALSGQNGEVDAGGLAPFDGARAKTQAELFESQAFFDEASGAGWNFFDIWALPLNGSDHARLYAVDLVASAFGETPNPTFEYVGDTSGYTITGTYAGGPNLYRFNIGDTGNLSDLDSGVTFSSEDAGTVTYTFPTSFTSVQGDVYSVRSPENSATITQRPITLSIGREDPANPTGPSIPNEAIKTYGETLTPSDVIFTTETAVSIPEDSAFSTAFFADPNSLISAGLDATAQVAGSPYTLDLNTLTFTGGVFDNYNITYNSATLFINPASLTINVDNLTKTVGEEVIFNGTEFTTIGLLNTDTVTNLTIDSAGAPASATILGSPYPINGSAPVGTGITNYTVTINPGQLTVTDLPGPGPELLLDIFITDVTKTYGETVIFGGTEFTSAGLMSGDTLDSLTISSTGAGPEAVVAGSPYEITGSDPVGNGIDDYTINIIPGRLTILPAPLLVTADDQSKLLGTEFSFVGNEFTVEGLLNDDTVTSATLTSAASLTDAGVTGVGGSAILIADPVGDGLANYQITFVAGVFIVAPRNLTITANDQTKVYGETFTFNGTEFTVSGLSEGDNVESITLSSAATDADAQVANSPFAITGSNAVGTGLEKYTLVFEDGSFEVTPAPLTLTAFDQSKQQGQLFTFDGTEFSATGLLNADSVTTAVINSDGAAIEAQAVDSPFAITIGDVNGTGLDNYALTRVDGAFTVQNQVTPPIINPVVLGSSTIANPPDSVDIGFAIGETLAEITGVQTEGVRSVSLPEATETLEVVDSISDGLEAQANSCGAADQDFNNYMSCLSQSLDTYSNALDQIANELPSGLETVSATIRTAADEVRAATARAQRRLATATSDAERRSIRAQAVAEAQGAITTAKAEIRKAIGLIRADDPEVAAVQRNTGARIVQAFDTVESSLVRAVEL